MRASWRLPPCINRTGVLLAVLAAAGFSAKAIFVKLAYVHGVDAVTVLALRMAFALPFYVGLAVWSARTGPVMPLGREDLLMLLGMGLLGYYLSSLLDLSGLQYIPASLERVILFLYPTLLVMLTALTGRKGIPGRMLALLALCYAGVLLLFAEALEVSQGMQVRGILLVFASTLTYALFLLGSQRVIPRVGPVRFTAYSMIVASLAALVHFGVNHQGPGLLSFTPAVYGLSLALALFSTVLPSLMLAESIRRIGAEQTALIGSIGPVATILLGYAVLDERLTLMQWLGAGIVVITVLAIGHGAGRPVAAVSKGTQQGEKQDAAT